jgi:hypothetical protein
MCLPDMQLPWLHVSTVRTLLLLLLLLLLPMVDLQGVRASGAAAVNLCHLAAGRGVKSLTGQSGFSAGTTWMQSRNLQCMQRVIVTRGQDLPWASSPLLLPDQRSVPSHSHMC